MAKNRFQGVASVEDDDFKRAFIDGNLVIDCSEIRLVQLGADPPIEYVSAGSIEVGANRGVVVRLVAVRSQSDAYDPIKFLRRLSSHRPGVIVPDDHYYRLEAKDVAGQVWSCESGELDRSDREDSVVLLYTAKRIACTSSSEAPKDYALLVFLDDLSFPKNTVRTTTVDKGGERWSTQARWDLSTGSAGGFDLTFEGLNARPEKPYSEFVAVLNCDVHPPAGFEDRLLEAIRFCTATMATPTMSQVSRGGTRVIELIQARELNKGLVEPPVAHRGQEPDFFRLFDCYYRYACSNAEGKEFSPLSAKIGGLFALKGVWIETVVLLLAVAVERMLNETEFKHLGKPEAEVRAEVDRVLAATRGLELSESMSRRIQGSLSGFKTNSASDRMHALMASGLFGEDDPRTWKQSRNAAAHGSFEIGPHEFQEAIDSAYKLTTMIYKLAFFCIGYSGAFTDYSARGWPVRLFELDEYRRRLAEPAVLQGNAHAD